ncbi:MAG: hypothetical protein ACPGVO_05170 [Spirulinaceae cyanobacterium]
MRNIQDWGGAIALGLCLGMMPQAVIAQDLDLTGISVFAANGAAGFSGQAQWDTVTTLPNHFWDLWLTNEGLEGNLRELETGYALTPGEHQFTLFADGLSNFLSLDRVYGYGLNLFFNGATVQPGISIFSPLATAIPTAPHPFSPTGAGIANLEAQIVSGAATTTFTEGSLVAELTEFVWFSSQVHGRDRVAPYAAEPNGHDDMVGQLTLNVVDTTVVEAEDVAEESTDVPEPGVILALLGVAGLVSRFNCQIKT